MHQTKLEPCCKLSTYLVRIGYLYCDVVHLIIKLLHLCDKKPRTYLVTFLAVDLMGGFWVRYFGPRLWMGHLASNINRILQIKLYFLFLVGHVGEHSQVLIFLLYVLCPYIPDWDFFFWVKRPTPQFIVKLLLYIINDLLHWHLLLSDRLCAGTSLCLAMVVYIHG